MSVSDIVEDRFLAAMQELLKTKSFEKLTVSEICKEASLSRGSFYNHFLDKYDLSFLHYRRQAEIEFERYKKSGDWLALTCNLYHHFLNHKDYYMTLVKQDSQNSFVPSLIKHSRPFFVDAVNAFHQGPLNEEELFSLNFNIYGAAYTAIEWIRNGMKEYPEKMSQLVIKNTPWLYLIQIDETSESN